jgi:hypothetical protein
MKTRVFSMRCDVHVPARGLVGIPPRREDTLRFVVPAEYHVRRDGPLVGARIVGEDCGGLTEVRREFREVPGGIELVWELKNEKSTPVTGRDAFLEIELVGESVERPSLSDKYKRLRLRFFNQFYFSGLVAEYVELSSSSRKVKFADQTIYMGQALLALGTEMAIIRASGGDLAEAKARCMEILDAIERLDRVAGPRFSGSDAIDGFFVRDDVEGPNDPRLGGLFSQCESDWQNPEEENASPSGDQIFGLMYGLWGVVSFSGDSNLSTRAKTICARLFDYARRCDFELKLPNGHTTRRGADMRWLASLMHGLNKDVTGQDLFSQCRIMVAGQSLPLTPIAAFWDDHQTARTVSDLAEQEFRVPLLYQKVELNSFALHIILMTLATAEVWSQKEIETVASKVNHHAAVLFYCAAHSGSLPEKFSRDDVIRILDTCPDGGPRESLASMTGWNKDNRWIRAANLFEPSSGGPAEYNGLDWMILHNLEQIVFVGV